MTGQKQVRIADIGGDQNRVGVLLRAEDAVGERINNRLSLGNASRRSNTIAAIRL